MQDLCYKCSASAACIAVTPECLAVMAANSTQKSERDSAIKQARELRPQCAYPPLTLVPAEAASW